MKDKVNKMQIVMEVMFIFSVLAYVVIGDNSSKLLQGIKQVIQTATISIAFYLLIRKMQSKEN